MKLKLVVVEDEFSILLDITRRLETMEYDVVGSAMSYEEALAAILEHKPDLLLLDINLNAEKSGIDIARKVHENFPLPVVFLTASSDKLTFEEALKTKPMGFIVKPFKDEDLRNNIEMAFMRFNEGKKETTRQDISLNEPYFLKYNKLFENIDLSSIVYLESMDNYTKIHSSTKTYTINTPLKNLHSQLPDELFVRIHKSYVISNVNVKAIDGNFLTMKNGDVLPIGKTFKADFLKSLNIIE